MKGIIVFLLIWMGMMTPVRQIASISAEAASAPHVVVEGEVWLLSEEGIKLFLLPEGYYVRIVNLDESFYFVRFNDVDGKVAREGVRTTGYHASAPATKREIGLFDSAGDVASVYLKSAPSSDSETVAEVRTNDRVTFLGHYPAESELWYFVQYNSLFGYLRAERTDFSLSFPAFSPEPDPAPEENINQPSEPSDSSPLLKTLIALGVSVPAVLIVFLLFRSGSKRTPKPKD